MKSTDLCGPIAFTSFLHLPSPLHLPCLQLMHRMASSGVPITDQVCYRILMDQYTKHGKPAMAIKVCVRVRVCVCACVCVCNCV